MFRGTRPFKRFLHFINIMFSSERLIKKSRKFHRCFWCAEIINEGSSYYDVASKWEGNFWSGKFHTECYNAWSKTCDGEFTPGEYKRGGSYDDPR